MSDLDRQYPGQNADEVVQKVIHKHVMAVLPYVSVSVLLFLIGLVAIYWGAAGNPGIPQADFSGYTTQQLDIPLVPIGLISVLLASFMAIASVYVWWQNRLFITDENIVDMDQMGLFQRTIATLRLSRVQDISVQVKGPMQTIFHYGTVTVQTAGEKELFHFDYVPEPYKVKAIIVETYEKFAETKPVEGDGLIRKETPEPDVDRDNTFSLPNKPKRS
jgi:uncharacterized membrane protein YdbT with pleckstrin-like domain